MDDYRLPTAVIYTPLEAKMTGSKDGNQKTRIPYEPPTLFDLGGGVAYAKGECKNGGAPKGLVCKTGGSPGGSECKDGSSAGSDCKSGQMAGSECKMGFTASGGNCKDGNMAPSAKCDDGTAAQSCKKGGNTGKAK